MLQEALKASLPPADTEIETDHQAEGAEVSMTSSGDGVSSGDPSITPGSVDEFGGGGGGGPLENQLQSPEPHVSSTVTIKTPERSSIDGGPATSDDPVVWSGSINMPDVAR